MALRLAVRRVPGPRVPGAAVGPLGGTAAESAATAVEARWAGAAPSCAACAGTAHSRLADAFKLGVFAWQPVRGLHVAVPALQQAGDGRGAASGSDDDGARDGAESSGFLADDSAEGAADTKDEGLEPFGVGGVFKRTPWQIQNDPDMQQQEGESEQAWRARRMAAYREAGYEKLKNFETLSEKYPMDLASSDDESAAAAWSKLKSKLQRGVKKGLDDDEARRERQRLLSEASRLWELDSDEDVSIEDMRIRSRPLWMQFEQEREADVGDDSADTAPRKKFYDKALIRVPERDEKGRAYATGRRKTATARVWVKLGDGNFVVNKQPLAEYFERASHRRECLAPFLATRSCGAFDVVLTVKGGGKSGQAGAIKHGLANALSNFDPFLRPVLKKLKLTRRDPRMVERKKPGRRKARRLRQWVKR